MYGVVQQVFKGVKADSKQGPVPAGIQTSPPNFLLKKGKPRFGLSLALASPGNHPQKTIILSV
jgi:hypothetical protein